MSWHVKLLLFFIFLMTTELNISIFKCLKRSVTKICTQTSKDMLMMEINKIMVTIETDSLRISVFSSQ